MQLTTLDENRALDLMINPCDPSFSDDVTYSRWLRAVNMAALTSCCCSGYRTSKGKKLKESPGKGRSSRRRMSDNTDPDSCPSSAGDDGVAITLQSLQLNNSFTDREQIELREAFDMFDTNSDGKISCSELSTVIRLLRFDICDKDIQDMIKIVDKNENGVVDYDEYLSLMQRFSSTNKPDHSRSSDKDERTFEAFRVFDLDGNGYIDRQELRIVMNRLGENVSDDDVRAMFQEADLNADGRIDYSEFSQILLHLS